MKANAVFHLAVAVIFSVLSRDIILSQPTISRAKQGYSMRLYFNNLGVMGKAAYLNPGDSSSIGLEYPVGQPYEHIYGAGLWVAGKLDTATTGTSTQLKLVSVVYDGWVQPFYEFYPGSTPADTIWKVIGRNVPRPASWEPYWGNAIRRVSFSDNDHYCVYDDMTRRVSDHVPLNLKVIQSSFVWNDSYAEAIHIVEYKIINMGQKQIDSAYIGMFADADVGPVHVPNYYFRNFSGYYPSLAFTYNRVDSGSTPLGVAVIHTPRALDSLRLAFRWFPAQGISDPGKYMLLTSGRIDPDESPNMSDTRFILSFGPFTLLPRSNPAHDTLVVAFAIVSGQNLTDMRVHAARAKNIYLTGTLDVRNGDELPLQFELSQNYPNPFNPSTAISYELPTGNHVTLKVLDVLGREVLTVLNGFKEAGRYEAHVNASNLASGVYFYRLQAGSYSATKRMILMK